MQKDTKYSKYSIMIFENEQNKFLFKFLFHFFNYIQKILILHINPGKKLYKFTFVILYIILRVNFQKKLTEIYLKKNIFRYFNFSKLMIVKYFIEYDQENKQ